MLRNPQRTHTGLLPDFIITEYYKTSLKSAPNQDAGQMLYPVLLI